MTYQTIPSICLRGQPNIPLTVISAPNGGKAADDSKELPAHIVAERFERLLMRHLKPVFDPQLPDKQAGFRHGQCKTDQMFKLTDDIDHRFEENKSGIASADLTTAHDSPQYGTRAKHPTTAIDLGLLL